MNNPIRLYKFRSANCDHTGGILESGKFWCSSLWDQNDPMEGIYTYLKTDDPSDAFHNIFTEKNRYKICSFSGRPALDEPTIWGYYANGFKGIAIEIEIDPAELKSGSITPIDYAKCLPNLADNENSLDTKIKRIITTKLPKWEDEYEFRFLSYSSGLQTIGRITGIYFGDPHRTIENKDEILRHSETLSLYHKSRRKLVSTSKEKGYSCYHSHIIRATDDTWKVEHTPFEESDFHTILGKETENIQTEAPTHG